MPPTPFKPMSEIRFGMPLRERPELINIGRGTYGLPEQPRRMRFHMADVWCMHLYTYDARFWVDGEEHGLTSGSVSLIHPETVVEYDWHKPSTHVAAFFAFPKGAEADISAPAVFSPGKPFRQAYRDLEAAIGFLRDQHVRAEVTLWDVLWRFLGNLDATDARSRDTHPALQRMLALIEEHLAEPLTVSELAEASSVSTNHLVRLVRQRFGTTVVGYLRRRRAEKAREWLLHSTLSIKAIAAAVGVPNLQYFYRIMKREFGLTPGEIRAGKKPRTTR